MIWMTWRQFRAQALVGLAALVLLAGYLVVLGRRIHSEYDDTLTHCATATACSGPLGALADRYSLQADLLGYLLLTVPAVIGVFWGAPLIARELETGTHRLVWNQSVTRTRWLAAKLALVGLLSMTISGVYSLLLTWATGPVTTIVNNRFEPANFASHDIAPLGYTAFAFVLGAVLGLILRRAVPAMAATLVIFTALQIAVPILLRPHYQAPTRTSVPLTADLIGHLTKIGTYGDIGGLRVPGGPWVIDTSPILDSAGKEVGHTPWFQDCMDHSSLSELPTCLAKGNLHVTITEQPADRYWTFQYLETGLFIALAALLTALALRRIRNHPV
ncbi:ABC transporter permease subunit [Streptomyces sp. NBC_00536]|uniref:ABC transporter permease subunit n=1 Tax=Streptomyces sp. NBC_00536 TaxID=2975769 RepID=UPI002E808575|nr:ABC transporter permease subunit [Streptomyces sp. NBC_00536]WUC83177.1 ABC transporter permease subunit [Streptomyces sp. NBC_00536]